MLPGIITAPPARTDRAAFYGWLEAHGIDMRTFSQHAYERGEFSLELDRDSGEWQISTWQSGRAVGGAWIDGCSVVVAGFESLSAALLDLAAR